MNSLEQILMDRAINGKVQEGSMSPPPMPKPKLPPAEQRWKTAEEMKAAYRNNWQPNPVLLKHTK